MIDLEVVQTLSQAGVVKSIATALVNHNRVGARRNFVSELPAGCSHVQSIPSFSVVLNEDDRYPSFLGVAFQPAQASRHLIEAVINDRLAGPLAKPANIAFWTSMMRSAVVMALTESF